jgi:hypothetical protein
VLYRLSYLGVERVRIERSQGYRCGWTPATAALFLGAPSNARSDRLLSSGEPRPMPDQRDADERPYRHRDPAVNRRNEGRCRLSREWREQDANRQEERRECDAQQPSASMEDAAADPDLEDGYGREDCKADDRRDRIEFGGRS